MYNIEKGVEWGFIVRIWGIAPKIALTKIIDSNGKQKVTLILFQDKFNQWDTVKTRLVLCDEFSWLSVKTSVKLFLKAVLDARNMDQSVLSSNNH